MNAGLLDREVTIKEKVIANNAYNEEKVTGYQNITVDPVVWMAKDMQIGSENIIADQLVSENVTRWLARYREDLTAEMVIVYDGIPFEIESYREAQGKGFGRREAIEIKTIKRDNLTTI